MKDWIVAAWILTAWIMVNLVLYGILCYGLLEPNPLEWNGFFRIIQSLFAVCSAGGAVVALVEEYG